MTAFKKGKVANVAVSSCGAIPFPDGKASSISALRLEKKAVSESCSSQDRISRNAPVEE